MTFRKHRGTALASFWPFQSGTTNLWVEGSTGPAEVFCFAGAVDLFYFVWKQTAPAVECFRRRVSFAPTTAPQLTLVLVPVSPHVATIPLSFRYLSISPHCRKSISPHCHASSLTNAEPTDSSNPQSRLHSGAACPSLLLHHFFPLPPACRLHEQNRGGSFNLLDVSHLSNREDKLLASFHSL